LKDFWGKTKVDDALEFLYLNEPPEGYYLSFSWGKDSQVVYHPAILIYSDIIRAAETSGLMNPVGFLPWRGLRLPFPFGYGTLTKEFRTTFKGVEIA
jgi:hypothetical protein